MIYGMFACCEHLLPLNRAVRAERIYHLNLFMSVFDLQRISDPNWWSHWMYSPCVLRFWNAWPPCAGTWLQIQIFMMDGFMIFSCKIILPWRFFLAVFEFLAAGECFKLFINIGSQVWCQRLRASAHSQMILFIGSILCLWSAFHRA